MIFWLATVSMPWTLTELPASAFFFSLMATETQMAETGAFSRMPGMQSGVRMRTSRRL